MCYLLSLQRQTVPSEVLLGQLPPERVTPGTVFERTGVDYAGPLQVKYGRVHKSVVLEAYICVHVSLTVKAVHLKAVSDLSFVAALCMSICCLLQLSNTDLEWQQDQCADVLSYCHSRTLS